MSLSEKYKPVTTTASDALRLVYGPHAAKKIARDFGVAIVTAKLWLQGRFPVTRHPELCRRIEAELDRQDEIRAEIRRQIQEAKGGSTCENNFAVGSSNPRACADKRLSRPQSDRSQTHRMGAMT